MSLRTCRDVRADLSAYLDGDLDAGLTGGTRVHLESCADCRFELDQLRLTVGALRGLPELPPPAAILAGVRARLRPEPWYRRLPDSRQWLLGVPVGALATVLVVVGISLFQARYSDMSQTLPQGHFPQAPAPPAREMPTTPAPIATTAPATRSMVADRQAAAPARRNVRAKGSLDSPTLSHDGSRGEKFAARESSAVAGVDKQDRYRGTPAATVERVAPTDLKAGVRKAEPLQPSPPEPRVAAPKDALREESQPVENRAFVPSQSVIPETKPAAEPSFMAKGKESRVLFDRVTESAAGLRSAGIAVEKATRIEVVCLLPADGYTVEDIERLLRREGAGEIAVSVLEPRAVLEAFAPHRERLASLPEPSHGWAVTASVRWSGLSRLLEELNSRTYLRILEQPAAPTTLENPTVPRDLRITILR